MAEGMRYTRQRFTIFQKVATVEGIGKIFAIDYTRRICDVVFENFTKLYHFSDLVKV
jgi:hypothetical protein